MTDVECIDSDDCALVDAAVVVAVFASRGYCVDTGECAVVDAVGLLNNVECQFAQFFVIAAVVEVALSDVACFDADE